MDKLTVLDVTGMSCASCVRHVRGALAPLAGVSDVEVRLEEGKALVKHDPGQTSPEGLIEALRDAGYDASVPAA